MIYWFLAWRLRQQIHELPGQVCFMITGPDMRRAPEKLLQVARWSRTLSEAVRAKDPGAAGISGLTFHISTIRPGEMDPCLPVIRKIGTVARLHLHIGDHVEVTGSGMDVVVAIGQSGREEIAACIRKMAEEQIPADRVDEQLLDSRLTFRYAPDMVVKTGGDHLTDFLIWQSVYSELFFSDVNWEYFREVDFLRLLRDYQNRIRRFGK